MIDDQREVPSKFHDAGQLAAMLDGMADGLSGDVIDSEHGDTLHTPGEQIASNLLPRQACLYGSPADLFHAGQSATGAQAKAMTTAK